ncbi:MAG: ABC transporter permease [Tannerellaceae bacterium]|nr:ABC transporter permease [Tannerellaceae bacterium]
MKTLLRNSLNVLRRFKVATILNILGLTVAFAAFILIMMQVDYDYNFNKDIPDANRIFRMETIWENSAQAVISRPLAEIFFQSSPHIQAGAIVSFPDERVFEVEQNGSKRIFKESFLPITPEFTDVFAFEMTEGTVKSVREPNRVLIPKSIARKLFANQPAMDKQLSWEDQIFYVSGVYKDFPVNSSVKNSIFISMQDENKESWGNSNYQIYVLLDQADNADTVIENFRANFNEASIKERFGDYASSVNARLTPFLDLHYIRHVDYDPIEKSSQQTIAVLFTIAIVLIIIASINFTNFSMALTPMRVKSINTQKVMGADTGMLRNALLSEAFVICILSYLLSLGLVWIFSQTNLRSLVDGNISFATHSELILITAGIALMVALAAGLYPAYYITSFSPALVLKGNFGLSPKGRTLRSLLIGFQYISSFALIIGATFMYLQNNFMQTTSLGYTTNQLIITKINSTINKNRQAFTQKLQSFAGIEATTFSTFLLSSNDRYMGWGRGYKDSHINFQCLPVDTSFLNVMDMPILEGRNFRPGDEATEGGAMIFNERAKFDYNMEIGDKIDAIEVIGFISDVKFASLRQEVEPMAFYVWGTQNWGQQPNFAYIKVNAGTDLRSAMHHVNETLSRFDPGYPFESRFFDNVLQRLYEKETKMTTLITLFSLLAIFISIVGVFGLVIFESQYKMKEIGLRKVLGSSTQEIIIMFNKVYLRILIICFILAAPIGYFAIKNWQQNFAFRVPLHWWVFAAAFFVIGIITVITVTFQNWRAANANPVESIKTE